MTHDKDAVPSAFPLHAEGYARKVCCRTDRDMTSLHHRNGGRSDRESDSPQPQKRQFSAPAHLGSPSCSQNPMNRRSFRILAEQQTKNYYC